ncbi:ankyrin repeat-containing domain protein, partial [Cadophora sp. MPI-SDFR-AT-0126]
MPKPDGQEPQFNAQPPSQDLAPQKPQQLSPSQGAPETAVFQAQELERKSKQSKEAQDEEKSCLQAFGYSDYRQHKNRNPLRVPDTCRWVLENERFLDWRSSANDALGLLWISADPGCGKSVLARSLIDENLLHPPTSTPPTVCYFFFKYGISEQQGGATCIRAILRQIFQQQPFLIKYALPEYRRIGSNMTESFEALWGIFRDATSDPHIFDTICLVDALDECDEASRLELIDNLKEIYSTEATSNFATRLKILVTSRPYEEIDRRFRTLTNVFPTIRLKGEEESKIISQEINLVTEAVVPRIALELNLPGNVEKTLLDRLLSVPNRTYLWLHLILDEVRKSLGASTPQRMLRIVETLPETVDAAYDAILDRSTDATLARRLLHILICATRDLDLDELNIALHIKPGMHKIEDLDLEANNYFQITVRNLCGLFINVIDSKIYFIHQTAREYLLKSGDSQDQSGSKWRRSLDPDVSHAILAECCIVYLHFDPLDTNDFAFLNYSALNWTYHYEEGYGEAYVADIAFELCDPDSMYFLSWFNIYRTEGNFISGTNMFPIKCNHLMIACAFGFSEMAEQLLLLKLKPDLRSSNVTDIRSSPLCLAVEQGDLETVRLLLECGFPVNQAVKNKAPLERTILKMYMDDMLDIFKLLLQYGADLNPPDRSSALQYAAQNDDHEIVTILVNNNSDVNHSISSDTSVPAPALCSAAKHGSLPTIRILLQAGADVNIQDTRASYCCLTPLHYAVRFAQCQAVSLLLSQEGIEVDAGSGDYGTPLSYATYCGNTILMEQLLKAGADPNRSDGKRTPLVIAAEISGPGAAKMLLSYGAKAHCEAALDSEMSPLGAAARTGNLATLKILLDHGADPRKTWSDGKGSVFTGAMEGDHLHIVRCLLE